MRYAEPNYIDRPAYTPNDTFFFRQWHLSLIGCEAAWDIQQGGDSDVIVAVIDSGIAYRDESAAGYPAAPDLVGVNFVHPYDAIDPEPAEATDGLPPAVDGYPLDTLYHGTHVTGTIAQRTNNGSRCAGVAFGVSIMPVRTLTENYGSHDWLSDGFHWAADHGAHIINYSAGGGHSQTKEDAIEYAYNAGVLIVAAMGNATVGQENSDGSYPARYPEVFGVSALRLNKQLAVYSHYGSGVEFCAPGGETSEDLDGNGRVDGVLQETFPRTDPDGGFAARYLEGTSMATPHVTGVAALLLSAAPAGTFPRTTAGVEALRLAMRAGAEDLGTTGWDNQYGWGMVRPDLALTSLVGTPPTLTWAGTSGYTSDGVKPDTGETTTTFDFRVRITDAEGDALTKARVRIQSLGCDGTWSLAKSVSLSHWNGDLTTGAVYHATTTLPNAIYQYKFQVSDQNFDATGTPTDWTMGPEITGTPFLCWSQNSGYGDDGAKPDSGNVGDDFTFKVVYMDSRDQAPRRRRLVIRKDNVKWLETDMAERDGDYQTGMTYRKIVTLDEAGDYKYRFEFTDASGYASGDPTSWTRLDSTISGGGLSSAQVTALSAAPVGQGGVELRFTLSQAAAVSATVYNVAGRPVGTITRGRDLDAGINSLTWSGRSDSGLQVPSGLYLVKVTAASPTGAESSQMAAVSLRR